MVRLLCRLSGQPWRTGTAWLPGRPSRDQLPGKVNMRLERASEGEASQLGTLTAETMDEENPVCVLCPAVLGHLGTRHC